MQGKAMAMAGTSAQSDGMTPLKSSSLDAVSTLKADEAEEAIAEPELLALIIELRLSAGDDVRREKEKSSTAGSSKSNAASTSTAVDTLDLCHRKIEKLPNEMVNIIRDDVVRLALGYNLINGLPSNFSELSKLRYLNIRANLITTFPSVLCMLPSLEILDISRNKIRKLPSEPGRLSELRVLSISNNKLRKLPSWLQHARHLRILKIEGNSITWPPPHISVMPPFDKASTNALDGNSLVGSDKETQQANKKRAEDRHMALWIQKVRRWMAENDEGNDEQKRDQPKAILSEVVVPATSEGPVIAKTEPLRIFKKPIAIADGGNIVEEIRPGGEYKRSVSTSLTGIGEKIASDEERDKVDEIIALPVNVPSRMNDSPAKSILAAEVLISPNQRFEAQHAGKQDPASQSKVPLVSSPEQVRKAEDSRPILEATTGPALQKVTQVTDGHSDSNGEKMIQADSSLVQHSPNSSLSNVQPASTIVSNMATTLRRGLMRNKKSLPDLRQTIAIASTDKKELTSPINEAFDSVYRSGIPSPSMNGNRRLPLPQAFSENMIQHLPGAKAEEGRASGPDKEATGSDLDVSSAFEDKLSTAGEVAQRLQTDAAYSEVAEGQRNRYFRRFSILPSSTISKSIPISVLQCVDATRGILYALSQMHSALKQYIVFASDERMTSQLSRSLNIANASMGSLIQSLDQFDSLSRINSSSPYINIVHTVILACSDSVITFRKIISLLHLQLKTLQKSADIRYTRTLLLLLYGSLAEISQSWSTIEPLLVQVIPYLNGQEVENTASVALAMPQATAQNHTLPSIAEASSPILASSDRSAATYAANHLKPQRRRHAGSFSAQDVAQGANMVPSAPLPSTNAYEETRKGQRPTALGPFAEQQGNAMSYQVQQGDLDGTDLIHTGRAILHEGERMSPQSIQQRLRRNEDSPQVTTKSKRSISNTSAGNIELLSRSQGSSGGRMQAVPGAFGGGSSANKIPVDDHLVLLLVKVTSVAYGVWASIMDHLNAVDAMSPARNNSANFANESKQRKTPESSPDIDIGAFPALSPKTPLQNGSMSHRNGFSNKMMGSSFISPASDASRARNEPSSTSSISSKLQMLRDMTVRLVEQTHVLQACCDKVQERSGVSSAIPASSNDKLTQQQQGTQRTEELSPNDDIFQQVYMESSTFIKSILQISHFIKNISLDHTFPQTIKLNLAQLTTCARDLTLHLHFLGGPPSSQPTAISTTSPAQHRGQ